MKARERTLKLVQEIQQRERENDRLMRLRQLEREKAEQLRRPTEDLLVNDLVKLPALTKLKWVRLPAHSFADLVMVFEFSHSFDDFLEIDRVPRFSDIYAGLFNVLVERDDDEEETVGKTNGLVLLTMHLVKAAVLDGGSRVSGRSLVEDLLPFSPPSSFSISPFSPSSLLSPSLPSLSLFSLSRHKVFLVFH